jgi:hypothetical protein
MKEEILIVKGCQTCPMSIWNNDNKGWLCGNFKRKPKHIDVNFIDNYHPTWCPLKKKSLKLILS